MIDIHAHILPGVDDGAQTLAESMKLLEQAVKEGITDIIATPHAYNPHFDVPQSIVLEKVELLNAEIKKQNLPINIHSGQEIRVQDSTIEKLASGEALTLADSKYVLLELPTANIPAYTVQIIQGILNLDKVPIIAHPERNRAIAEKPSRLLKLINHGALAQITAGSLAGHFGRNIQKQSLQLVDANLVHTYGSDVHHAKTRPFLFDAGLRYLEKHKRLDAVDIFLENNARIVENIEVIILEPKELEKAKWWRLFA
ncbi:tyrosine-protein phosphatase [Psychrobacillus soli]|uniref:Tyrosine-protein phosphatase n=1 Tax=Psychrobacillus soli TaxID=1543965 RepID=A0A544T5K3_9BACI|nr:CpsB/CapC family capsule biosynthesis tyrosine phosphatase [Psychrobacillus soli]TQR12709.1 capsular biosynthesis protein [Psychrobacillus soli]